MKSSVRWVLAGRRVLFILSLGAVLFALRTPTHEQAEIAAHYACPMHPEVIASQPGQCPICRMALERTLPSAARDSVPAAPQGFRLAKDAATPLHSETGEFALRHLFSEETRAPAWFESEKVIAAILYRDEVAEDAKRPIAFSLGTDPKRTLEVERSSDAPQPWDAATVVVHFRPSAPDAKFHAGDIGWVRIAAAPREALAIPNAAVLYGEKGAYVLIPSADHRAFSSRSVELGRVVNGLARVVAGLDDHERIAIGDVFFLDAEQRLRSRTPMSKGAPP